MPRVLFNADGQRVAEAALLSELKPGGLLAAGSWYDALWQAHTLRCEAEPGHCIIRAPDRGRYDEWVGGPHLADGPEQACVLNSMGDCPERLRGSFYRFRAYPGRAELLTMLRLAEAESQRQASRVAVLENGDGDAKSERL